MATIRAYTTIEQSRKLAEILPLESADMWYSIVDNEPFICLERHYEYEQIPCWSLAALLGVLPMIDDFKPVLDLEINCIQYPSDIDLSAMSGNPVDACVAMIELLHELKML